MTRCDEIAKGADPSVLTSVFAARARLAGMIGDFAAAREFAAEAKRLYDELGMRVTGLVLAQTTGTVEALAGRLDEAEQLLREAMTELEALGERAFLSTLVADLADVVYRLGRHEEAESLARRALELGADYDIATQASGRAVEAKAAARLGRVDSAEQLAREAVALAATTDFVDFHGTTLTALGEVLELAGKPEEASAAFREALELFDRKGSTVAAARVRAQLATVAA
jgi:tetratricopeptide (TPR) repeat protein